MGSRGASEAWQCGHGALSKVGYALGFFHYNGEQLSQKRQKYNLSSMFTNLAMYQLIINNQNSTVNHNSVLKIIFLSFFKCYCE